MSARRPPSPGRARRPAPFGIDLGQAAALADPRTLLSLGRAGLVDPRRAVAAAGTLPWLVGHGASLGWLSQLNAVARGSAVAVHDRGGSISWRELDGRANRAARAFGTLGLRAGDPVGLLLRNGREFLECVLAAQKAGLVASPLNTWAKPAELEATLHQAGARVLVFDRIHAEQMAGVDRSGLTLVAVGQRPQRAARSAPRGLDRALAYEELLAQHSSRPLLPIARRPGTAPILVHTSGTTGRPKGAPRDATTTGVREFAGLLSVVPYRAGDVILCPAPLFHAFGLLTLAVGCVLGATFVLPERFDPAESLALIERHRVTAASMVPVMIRRVVSLPRATRERHDVSTLRILLASGSALPPDLRRAVTETFGEVLYDLYGSTEAGWVAIASPRDIAERPGTVGRPARGVEVAVFSKSGRRLRAGATGEIFVRSHTVFGGYTSGERTTERQGYLSTGDVGRLDPDGYLYVEGRADDIVVVGGENVSPREVEDVIRRVRGVRDVAVLGVPDQEYGHVLAAFVAGTAKPDTIRCTCRRALASFKVPRRIEVVQELPRTASGKVRRRDLT